MKFVSLLPFLAIPALASPAFDSQIIFDDISHPSEAFGDIASGVTEVLHDAENILGNIGDKVEQWVHNGRDFIKQHGHTCSHPLV
jgi:cathepsin A (carboxypeptidase C)